MNAINTKYSAQQTPKKKQKQQKKSNWNNFFSIFYSVRHQNPFIILSVIRKICLLFCHWYGEDNKKKLQQQQHVQKSCDKTTWKMSPTMNATETMKPDDVGFIRIKKRKKHFIMKFKAGFNFHLGE